MRSTRRLGALSSETRSQLVEAAAKILAEQGAAAVTARNLAETVGLRRHIVHYYFGTIEDLFVAVLQRDSARAQEWLSHALTSDDPIRAIWELGSKAAAITLEFSVLAARSEVIRAQFRKSSETFRMALSQALERHLLGRGITSKLPAEAITLIVQSIAYTLSIEALLGIEAGHKATKDYTARLIGILVS